MGERVPGWMGPVLIPHDCEERQCATSPYRAGPYHGYTEDVMAIIRRRVAEFAAGDEATA